MSREALDLLHPAMEHDALTARLASVERAYDDLLQRVHRYERERADIRARLEGILRRLPASDTSVR